MPKVSKLKYTKKDLDRALIEIQNNEDTLPVRKIAEKYGIPRTTLRLHRDHPGHKTSMGPMPILTHLEEGKLEEWIITCARKGFPRNKENILDSVQKFLEENPRPNSFLNNRPGIGWWRAFLKRHPKLSVRTSEGVTKASSCVSENDIREWFHEVRSYINEKGISEVLNQPHRVFNADETNFQICQSTGLVLAEKGARNVYNIEHSKAKESITALFTFSAAGDICCPFIVYPYQRLPEKVCESLPEGWGVGKSDNGWMTTEVFYEFIANVFYPYLVSKAVEFPVILFVDGHKTHLNYHLSQLCTHLQIELIALYPNATRIIQPADVAAFRPLKVGWRKHLQKRQLSDQSNGITKLTFAPVLNEVLKSSVKSETLVNGFRACGLCPFDPDVIDYSKCLGKSSSSEVKALIPETATITFDSFRKIVGSSLCDKFQCDSFHTTESNIAKMYNLWKEFLPEIRDQGNKMLEETLDSNQKESTGKSFAVSRSHSLLIELDSDQGEENSTPVDLITNSQQINLDHMYCGPQTSKSHAELDHQQLLLPEFLTPHKSQPNVHPEVTASSAVKIVTPQLRRIVSSFGDYLVYPETPIRKIKRKTERQPFAISSTAFKLACQNKQSQKENQIKEKEIKKLEKEKKKIENIIKNSEKTEIKDKQKIQEVKKIPTQSKITVLKKVVLQPIDVCVVCKKVIYKFNINCSSCHQSFHSKCIPDNHKKIIPDESDMILFVCHFCFKMDDY